MALAVTDLPEPDSPTTASVRPAWTSNETPRTAFTTPASPSKSTARSLMLTSGCCKSRPLCLGLELVPIVSNPIEGPSDFLEFNPAKLLCFVAAALKHADSSGARHRTRSAVSLAFYVVDCDLYACVAAQPTLLFALYRAPSLVFPGPAAHIERFARPEIRTALMLGEYPQYLVEETPDPAVMNQMVREQTKGLAMVCAGWASVWAATLSGRPDPRSPPPLSRRSDPQSIRVDEAGDRGPGLGARLEGRKPAIAEPGSTRDELWRRSGSRADARMGRKRARRISFPAGHALRESPLDALAGRRRALDFFSPGRMVGVGPAVLGMMLLLA